VTAAAGGGGISGASVDIYDSGGNFITPVSTGLAGDLYGRRDDALGDGLHAVLRRVERDRGRVNDWL
jgi:hypothetical protein